jgi:DNA mismatch repair protein MutS
MAGMPDRVVDRAKQVLVHLEASHAELGTPDPEGPQVVHRASTEGIERDLQLSFFQLDDPALERIRKELTELDIDTLTPVEALFKLNEIKRMVEPAKGRLKKA